MVLELRAFHLIGVQSAEACTGNCSQGLRWNEVTAWLVVGSDHKRSARAGNLGPQRRTRAEQGHEPREEGQAYNVAMLAHVHSLPLAAGGKCGEAIPSGGALRDGMREGPRPMDNEDLLPPVARGLLFPLRAPQEGDVLEDDGCPDSLETEWRRDRAHRHVRVLDEVKRQRRRRARKEANIHDDELAERRRVTGKMLIGTRWIVVTEGDSLRTSYRSRLVAEEFKVDIRPELFAATPPTECLRMLLSRAAEIENRKVLHVDVSRAYFYAKAVLSTFIKPSAEEPSSGDEGLVGKTDYVDV